MKTSPIKFIVIFVLSAFAFVIITNLLLHPVNGDWYAGTNSPVAWQRTLAAVIYPVKVILIGPLATVLNDPDPAPPVRGFFCAVYWSIMGLVLYFVIDKVKGRSR